MEQIQMDKTSRNYLITALLAIPIAAGINTHLQRSIDHKSQLTFEQKLNPKRVVYRDIDMDGVKDIVVFNNDSTPFIFLGQYNIQGRDTTIVYKLYDEIKREKEKSIKRQTDSLESVVKTLY